MKSLSTPVKLGSVTTEELEAAYLEWHNGHRRASKKHLWKDIIAGRIPQGPAEIVLRRRAAADRCSECSIGSYGHRDHAHAALVAEQGRCPFGDCGEFKALRAAS